MMTPGQASRTACWISLLTLTSQDGRWPLFGSCWRRWICMMLAPALKAALASHAISSGVTGTWCCFGSVSTPFSAQVMTALSLMRQPLVFKSSAGGSCGDYPPASCVHPLSRGAGLRPPVADVGAVEHAGVAAVDREIPRAPENGARLQSIEAADRVAEMRRVGIADVLRQVRQIEILIGKVQQM